MDNFYPTQQQEEDADAEAGYKKACKDIKAMEDGFLVVVWESICANHDPPSHRDGLPWDDWVQLIYSAMETRNLTTQVLSEGAPYVW